MIKKNVVEPGTLPEMTGKVVMLEESRTIQDGVEECDINVIVARAKRGEDVSFLSRNRESMYLDLSEIPSDLAEIKRRVQHAEDLFMGLDAHVRERFKNDPAVMIDFLNDPKNREEGVSLGIIRATEVDDHLETLKSIDKSLKASSDSKSSKAKPARDEE